MKPILLASSSIYRKALFSRLQLPFTCYSPDIDESLIPGESWEALVLRLSAHKAHAGAHHYGDHICIGSDEVAALGDVFLGKPGNAIEAKKQLQQMSGQKITFYTGICVFAPSLGYEKTLVINSAVKFRSLSESMIQNYIDKEQPFHSAGSFQSESLGSALIEYFEGSDPSAIIGLPLIALCDLLRDVGIEVI